MKSLITYSLYMNLVSTVMAIWFMGRSFRRNNLIGAIYWFIFAFLITGQAVHISLSLYLAQPARYLFNYITPEGHFIASFCLLLMIALIWVINLRFPEKNAEAMGTEAVRWDRLAKPNIIAAYYYFLWTLFLSISLLLVWLVGGVDAWLFSGRPMASGMTILVLAYGFVMYPLLIKTASGIKPILMDYILFFCAFIMAFSFSRINALFFVFMWMLIYYYRMYELKGKRFIEKKKWALAGSTLVLAILFMAYGTYRNIPSKDISIQKLFSTVVSKPELSLFSLDLNYRISVEGMSGFSAAISEFVKDTQFRFDYGISLLGSLTQFIPAPARHYFGDFIDYSSKAYWHLGSIVPSGLEAMFVYYSFFGIIIYAFLFFWFAYAIHSKIINRFGNERVGSINSGLLVMTLLASFGVQIIRGSMEFFVQFTAAELMILGISVWFFRLFHRIKLKTEGLS